jgi:hypothetical protein
MGALALPINAITSTAATAAGTGASVGVTAGLLSNPVTAIAGIGLSLFTAIDGIFKAHHAKAVATEAAALNNAVPAVESAFGQVASAYDSGQVDVAGADAALDQTLSSYDTLVYQDYGAKKKSGNGLDYIKGVLTDDANKIKSVLGSGGGSVQIPSIPSHAGFSGAQALDLQFSKPVSTLDPAGVISSAVASLTGSTATGAASSPNYVLWIVIAFVALLVLKAL